MHRRDLLHVIGSAAVLPFLPRGLEAAVRFTRRVHTSSTPLAAPLDRRMSDLVAAMAERIIPETDTPGAGAVGVPAFIEHIVSDWMSDDERRNLLAGLGKIDAQAGSGGGGFAALAEADQVRLLLALDGAEGPDGSAEKAYARIKQLTTYGYFTSERVMKEVLHTVIIPGRFDGCVQLTQQGPA
jgi:glucoside 3-dehydrogenase (cytochrome c) hitch-hiker subunit